jgi:hypothetical protein
MRITGVCCYRVFLLSIFLFSSTLYSSTLETFHSASADSLNYRGAYYTGIYLGLFKSIPGKTDKQIDDKINLTFNQLFFW